MGEVAYDVVPVSDELALYDYTLPDELIARRPPASREDARLMIVDRAAGTVRHESVRHLPELLSSGDCLVLNDTRVVPARLLGQRAKTGGRWEGLFLEVAESGEWRLLGQTRGKLQPGERISIHPAHDPDSPDRLVLELVAREEEGIWRARPLETAETWSALERFGTIPLPPYIRREVPEAADFARYQTVYARHLGSVAAPTAGLHFTSELLARCSERDIETAYVTLQVGIGTFRPISVQRLEEHRMHSEWCEVPAEMAARLAEARARGARIIAVGTTTARTLESAARNGQIEPWLGATELFIRPGHEFRALDGLLTNFHLPRSSLLVLVSAFAGRELVLRAYAEAIREKYRFYSYGDAMLIV